MGFRLVIISVIFALASAGCSPSETVSKTPAELPARTSIPPETVEPKTSVELTDGHLTFEIPESWNAQIEDMTESITADGSAPQFNGHTAHQATITNPGQTVMIDVFANVPWPDVSAIDPNEIELLHSEPLDIGYATDSGDAIWLRAVIGENPEHEGRPHFGMFDGRFEDEQYLLVVAPYAAKTDRNDLDEVGGGISSFIMPFSESTAGVWWDEVITIAAGTINQSAAEELTGLEGLDAMQALLDTQEYEELVDVMSSFQVHVRE